MSLKHLLYKFLLDLIVRKGSIVANGKLYRNRIGTYYHAPEGMKFSVMDREGRVGLRKIL